MIADLLKGEGDRQIESLCRLLTIMEEHMYDACMNEMGYGKAWAEFANGGAPRAAAAAAAVLKEVTVRAPGLLRYCWGGKLHKDIAECADGFFVFCGKGGRTASSLGAALGQVPAERCSDVRATRAKAQR